MFLVVSRSNVHFGFDYPFFSWPIGHKSKIARPEISAPRKKFLHPCILSQYYPRESVLTILSQCTLSKTSWKHQKTLRFSDVFQGKRKGAFVTNGLSYTEPSEHYEQTSESSDINQDENFFTISNRPQLFDQK